MHVPVRTRRALIVLSMSAIASAIHGCAGAQSGQASSGSAATATAGAATRNDRLMARLRALSADSMEGRRAGTPGAARARRWLVRELTAIGAKPIGGSFEQQVKLPARAGSDTISANVVAFIAGRNSGGGPVIVLSAHYDHLGVRNGEVFNGADDDASGCVALLAIAERLVRDPPVHDVYLAFFEAEESGMHGSRAFVSRPPVPITRIGVNVNLDMVSRQDGKALWVAGTSHYPFLNAPAEEAARTSSVPIRFGHDTRDPRPQDDWTSQSDHKAFHDRGVPFLYLGVEDHPDYHKSGDDADKIDPNFYGGVVDFAHTLVRRLDARLTTFPARTK